MDRLRIQLEYLKFLARLECWDLVDRGLRRLPPLVRSCPKSDARTAHTFDADRLRAVLAFIQGRPDDGNRILRRWVDVIPVGARRIGYASMYEEWSNGLFRCGRNAEALEICIRGIQHCDTVPAPERKLPMLVRRAALLEAMDRPAEARAALDLAFEHMKTFTPTERRRRQAELLAARIEHHEGNVAEARRRMRAILGTFQERLASRESGTQGYLQLDEATAVRDHVHDIENFSPAAGYAFEMEWRSMGAAMTGRRAPTPGRWATRTSIEAPAPTHLVYRFTRKALIRWTRTDAGVALDTLPVTQRECLEDVREAIALLQSEPPSPGAALGPRAFARLRELAMQLLPAGLDARGAAPVPLRVSADGPLLALPFEALVAKGPHGEAPLAAWADVEYVHGWGVAAPPAPGPPVIVSSPTLSPDLERRYPWARSGTSSEVETRAALERWPGAIHLEGPRATRDTVMNRWGQAPLIYLAAHHVRDPDAPFLGFVPMAARPGAPLDDALLEMADVHTLDLSGCRLVVLASCASGAPYHLTARPGPSLADAFLDSGARAVVRSLWDVGEDETRELMSRFLATWRPEDGDAAALGRARRAVMATPAGASPRAWAAWGVQTTLPVTQALATPALALQTPHSRRSP